jgi:hypothetical protein
MNLNVIAQVFVPIKFSQTNGDNPPLAEFKGELEIDVNNPEALGKAMRGLISIASWDFSVVRYDVEQNLLTLSTHALGLDISEVTEFVTSRFGSLPGWAIYPERLVVRMKLG